MHSPYLFIIQFYPITTPFLKFRRFTPEFSPNFFCAPLDAQLRTNRSSPKFQWDFRRGENSNSVVTHWQSLLFISHFLIRFPLFLSFPDRQIPFSHVFRVTLRLVWWNVKLKRNRETTDIQVNFYPFIGGSIPGKGCQWRTKRLNDGGLPA